MNNFFCRLATALIVMTAFVFATKAQSQQTKPTTEQLEEQKKRDEERTRSDWANLKRYEADNKSLKPAATGEKRVVFMGNSITEGWLRADSAFFANRPYIDRGISGQTTPQMLIRFRPDVIDLKPAVVVILAGINDIAQNTGPMTLEQTFGNIVSMAELAKANKISVVLCSVLPAFDFPWRPSLQPAGKVVQLNAMIKNYAAKNKVIYVDYFAAMVDERNGLKAEYTYDGVHPTLAGYKVMEPLAEKGIAAALRKK
jgi:lysophospholipase L1-like esterase